MDQVSKRRGRPVPDAGNMKHIAFKLEEALAVENLYRPNLLLIQNDRKPWEVTLVARDGAVHLLRFLRIWFDLPQSVVFASVTFMDLFLERIKVQEKYLKCLAISCFFVAVKRHGLNIDSNQLVSVSQSNCSVNDMERMAGIVQKKLKLNASDRVTTCADFLTIYIDILELLARQWNAEILLYGMLNREELMTRLEVILTDSSCSIFRSSTLALALIQLEVENYMTQRISEKSVYFLGEMIQFIAVISEFQLTCKIKSSELVSCFGSVSKVLQKYDNQDKTVHCQNLHWRFSASTVAMCSRRRAFYSLLDPIQEQNQNF